MNTIVLRLVLTVALLGAKVCVATVALEGMQAGIDGPEQVELTKEWPNWGSPYFSLNSFTELDGLLSVGVGSNIPLNHLDLMNWLMANDTVLDLDSKVWDNVEQLWHVFMLRGHVARMQEDFDRALDFYYRALAISRGIQDERYKINALFACYELEEQSENLVLALEYFKEYVRLVQRMQEERVSIDTALVEIPVVEKAAVGEKWFLRLVVGLFTVILLVIAIFFFLPSMLGYQLVLSRPTVKGAAFEIKSSTALKFLETTFRRNGRLFEEMIDEEIVVDENKIELLAQLRGSKLMTNEDWEVFQKRFDLVHVGYLVKIRLKHPHLTPSEEKLCCLIRLHFSTKEIAQTFAISNHSVNVARYRLRKKLSLSGHHTLEEYLLTM